MKRFALLFAIVFLGISSSSAQKVGIKTNLLYDATATVNLGVEIGLHQRWTLDISGNFNAWSRNESTKWKHWFVQPEARYWFCDRFAGHFVGAHLLAGAFNFGNINNNIKFWVATFRNYPNIVIKVMAMARVCAMAMLFYWASIGTSNSSWA